MFHWDGGHMWMGWFFWLLLIGAIVWLVVSTVNKNRFGNFQQDGKESAMDILKKRYARGEISKQEFDQMKKDIEL